MHVSIRQAQADNLGQAQADNLGQAQVDMDQTKRNNLL